ncbi:hypothetical protein V6260_14405 [Pseudoalteromonas aliena]|uniref:hypothetical protein n=1 Tax=Pseudoalteromonas aliena TaxID=247523 RepID=UPI00311DE936
MSKLKLPLIALGLFLMLSIVLYISINQKNQQALKQKITQIEKQIALDLPLLDLSNELLKHSGNKDAVNSYISKLNAYINSSRLKVIAITPTNELTLPLKADEFSHSLNSNSGPVAVVFSIKKIYLDTKSITLHFVLLLISVLMSFWGKYVLTKHSNVQRIGTHETQIVEVLPLVLIIDLNNKTLSNNFNTDQKTCLANKPLCFYLALVEYCTNNDDVALRHNKDVPEELLELANKYFYRLIELGHTVRKRPNFNNSLEKTLSEIRAALDEVLSEYPEEKELYYPPKAYGEGSRSRLHSYGLANIKKGNIEIRGK